MEIIAPVLAIVGPTAIGKTDISIKIAKLFNCEVISVDSMQVYRYMDIGTAKITPEERSGIEHYLIDIVNPDEEYNASRFVEDALESIHQIQRKGRIPLLTGGTGLYLHSLKNGLFENVPSDKDIRDNLIIRIKNEGNTPLYNELMKIDPQTAIKIHKNDTSRIIRALEVFITTKEPLSKHIERQKSRVPSHHLKNLLTIGLYSVRDTLYQRINRRTLFMVEQGLEQEVNSLLERGYDETLKSMQAIGYRHMLAYMHGKFSQDKLFEQLSRDTRRYAKRQFTWFKKDTSIRWFDTTNENKIISEITRWFKS